LNISGTTTRKFGPQMFTNRFKNLATIHHHLLFDSLKGAFRGIPAVLIAGGPSLERDLHLLPLLKERAVIIAVDTVLPVLLKNGVVPDFMTTIDPQPMVFEKIADILPEVPPGIHLISAISGFPKVSKTFPSSQVYWVFAAKFFESWFNRLLGGKLLTAGAGTVAHLNLLAAVFMECSPIVFIGQDLAHSRDKSHVSGVALSSPNRTQKILEDTQNLQWVKGVDGHSVPTDRGFLDMKHYFERIISEHSGHYINATHYGVHIEGTEVLALTETLKCHALQQHDISGRLNALAQQCLQYDQHRLVQTFVDLISEMEDTQKKISKYGNLITKAKKQIRKLTRVRQRPRRFNELPPSTQNMIQKIDALSDATDKASTIWELVQELTMDGLRESERQKREIDQLAQDPACYLQWLSKNLERLGYVNEAHKNTMDLLYFNITEVLDFYQKEQGFLESIDRIEENNKKLEVLTALADLYIAFENYQLAKPVLEKNLRVQPGNADIYFKLGVVALHQANHDLAETDFQKAVEIDPQIQLKIQDVRQKFGDIYLGYIKRGDLRVRKKMLVKGLRYCNDHDGIITWMNQWASKALDNIAIKDDAGDIEKVKRAIDFWEDIADWDPVILALDLRLKAYIYAGKLALTRGDLEKAETKLKVALEKAPDHLESLQTMTEICFAAGKFEVGIHYLQHAIQLDAKCAVLWERIGDRLLAKEQPANAVSAYEQCFLHFPEKLELLKKIGECYLAIGNYDAARQALQFFRDRQAG
jgi:Tfp pilus assembly protein PilF